MPLADAEAFYALVPRDFTTTLFQQALEPAVLTTALLSAHMIIFWLSQDSNVTPPVCLTAFAAAAIAKTPPMATGLTAWRIAKGLYIIPLLFAYTPFLAGDFWRSLWIFAYGTVAVYALAGALEGFMEARISWPERALLAALGTFLIWPTHDLWKLAGIAAFALLFALHIRRSRRAVPGHDLSPE
jgi:TRAP-type uncharacterized transport system fused permease subunit